MTFPKYIDGQQISAYTKNDEIFDGYVHTKEGIKYAIDDNGKSMKLSELQKVKRIGTLLKEEAEADWEEQLNKFKSYYDDTFDTEKVEKANDAVKDKIVDEYINTAAADDTNIAQNKDEFKKDALQKMSIAAAQEQIDKGNSTVDNEIEKLKKEQSDDSLEESLFSNDNIQAALLEENKNHIKENKNIDAAYDACEDMMIEGKSDGEIIDYLINELGVEKSDAQEIVNFANDGRVITWESKVEPSKYDKISEQVDDEFLKALEEMNSLDNLVTKHIVEKLAEKFGADSKKALEETDNVPDAVLNLAEQVKQNRMKAE